MQTQVKHSSNSGTWSCVSIPSKSFFVLSLVVAGAHNNVKEEGKECVRTIRKIKFQW